jgi:hypothetical protein
LLAELGEVTALQRKAVESLAIVTVVLDGLGANYAAGEQVDLSELSRLVSTQLQLSELLGLKPRINPDNRPYSIIERVIVARDNDGNWVTQDPDTGGDKVISKAEPRPEGSAVRRRRDRDAPTIDEPASMPAPAAALPTPAKAKPKRRKVAGPWRPGQQPPETDDTEDTSEGEVRLRRSLRDRMVAEVPPCKTDFKALERERTKNVVEGVTRRRGTVTGSIWRGS